MNDDDRQGNPIAGLMVCIGIDIVVLAVLIAGVVLWRYYG